MKLVKSFGALFLVLILGIITYQLMYKPDQEKLLRETQERFLVRFDVNRIAKFTIGRPDSSVYFEKGIGRTWNITQPFTCEAENEGIYTLFRLLREAEVRHIIEEKPKSLANYGLDRPSGYLAVVNQDGNADTLFTGFMTPDETMCYVKFASSDRVVTIDRDLDDFLKLPGRAYRSRTLLNIAQDDVSGVEIMRQDRQQSIVMEKRGYDWYMAEPWDFPANQKNISEFLESLTGSTKQHFIAEQTDSLAHYGLDDPRMVIRVSLQPGVPEKILMIGKAVQQDQNSSRFWFAKQFDQDLIFTIPSNTISKFDRMPIWFVHAFPMEFNHELASRIVLEAAGNTLTFVRGSQGYWSLISPIDRNIENTTINMILSISRFLAFQDVFAYEPTADDVRRAGLEKPQVTISFYQGDTLIDAVQYGNSITLEEQNTYCRTSKRPVIYLTQSTVTATINQILETVFQN